MNTVLAQIESWPWAMISGVVGIIGIPLVIVIALLQRKRKILEYWITTAPVATVSERGAQSRVSILFDGKPVDSVHYSTVTVRNAGNVAIRPEDFVEPIAIHTRAGATILQADVRGPGNDVSEPVTTLLSTRYSPALLNRGEEVTFNIIHSGNPELDLTARVADTELRRQSTDALYAVTVFGQTVKLLDVVANTLVIRR